MTRNDKITAPAGEGFPVLTLGRYPQGRYGESRPLEWLVLDCDGDGRALLLSRYAIDCLEYDRPGTEVVTWKTCELRKWLNEWFYNVAFDDEERNRIIPTELENDVNPAFGSAADCNSADRVFLLSAGEIRKYMPEEYRRVCSLTDYMRLNVRSKTSFGRRLFCGWHTRSLCSDFDGSVSVTGEGKLVGFEPSRTDYFMGQRIGIKDSWAKDTSFFLILDKGVRPAVRVNLGA